MTLDDLVEEFRNHPTTREGVKSIVRALRDELLDDLALSTEPAIDDKDISAWFNEILGDAGAEKVAGGSTREDEQSCNSSDGSSPTTDHIVDTNKMVPDPAPAVCEWTSRGRNEPGFYSTPHGIRHMSLRHDSCVSCGKPIKFTEANHG